MVDEFISVLEKFLGTKRVEFSIAERWAQFPPAVANEKPLKEYLAKVCADLLQRCTTDLPERILVDVP